MAPVIRVRGLEKTFRVPVPCEATGPWGRLRHFLRNPSKTFTAVQDLSFEVEAGEVVGFLGANGSGKSTTIKMLTGILTPTGGELDVLGHVPYRDRLTYTRRIGLVMGQKSLLWWNIPVLESFKLYRDIYRQSSRDFERRLDQFTEMLEIRDILHVPVRKLSLGLRMRAEIAASLLHRPDIVFLDEPAIGLDVVARMNLKRFLRTVNRELGITIFLTTHNMFDVEDLCPRCILLDRGRLLYDGDVSALKEGEQEKVVELDLLEVLDEGRFRRALRRCRTWEQERSSYKLQVATERVVEVIEELFASARLANLNVIPPSLESVVERIFKESRDRGDRGRGGRNVGTLLQIAV